MSLVLTGTGLLGGGFRRKQRAQKKSKPRPFSASSQLWTTKRPVEFMKRSRASVSLRIAMGELSKNLGSEGGEGKFAVRGKKSDASSNFR